MTDGPLPDSECVHLLSPSQCTICNGRDAAGRAERWVVERWFVAKYTGMCVRCGDVFHPGEMIGVTVSREYVCGAHRERSPA